MTVATLQLRRRVWTLSFIVAAFTLADGLLTAFGVRHGILEEANGFVDHMTPTQFLVIGILCTPMPLLLAWMAHASNLRAAHYICGAGIGVIGLIRVPAAVWNAYLLGVAS